MVKIISGSINNTGTSGFNIGGSAYTYDVGANELEGGSKGPFSKGDVNVDHSVKDLPKKTKKTLSDYLGNLTKAVNPNSAGIGARNQFPVSGEFEDIKIVNNDGYPTKIKQSNTGFFPKISSYDSSEYAKISDKIKKGKENNTKFDGNDLLVGVQGNAISEAHIGNLEGDAATGTSTSKVSTSTPVNEYVKTILSKNRFTSAAVSYNTSNIDGKSSQIGGFNPPMSSDQKLGVYSKDAAISMGRLAQIGPVLSLRAGIELGSGTTGFDPGSTGADLGALLPGVAQLAIKRIEKDMLNAKSVLETLTDAEQTNFIFPGSLSWGTLNNTQDQFSGITAIGMPLLSAALIAAMSVAISALSLLLGKVNNIKQPTRDSTGRYALGKYHYNMKDDATNSSLSVGSIFSLDFGQLLGIRPTTTEFQNALAYGAGAFFNLDGPIESLKGGVGGIAGSLIGGLGNAFKASTGADAGFNVIVARAIIRSSVTIVDQLKNLGGNPINIVKQLLGLIEILRSSKIIAACNVFAQIGDSILTIPDSFRDITTPEKISLIDSTTDIPGSSAYKSRMNNSLKLAWSNSNTPSLYLLTKNYSSAAKSALNLNPPPGTGQDLQNSLNVGKDDRISTEDVEQMEKILDAEYVPFYFHDIRTNEIISFHAFISSLSDDYNANYESSDSYGRIEPIKIYKNTTRKIGVSFYVVSTSENDFSFMWAKINKLTTFMYPQFTKGKSLRTDDGTYKFTQPFSQMVGAAPLIRMRLGDLIKSNYSRFNLARLFGLGDAEFALNDSTEQIAKIAIENKNPILLIKPGDEFFPSMGTTYKATSDGPQVAGNTSIPFYAANARPPLDNGFYIVKVINVDKQENKLTCEVKVAKDATDAQKKAHDDTYKNSKKLPKNSDSDPVGKKFIFSYADLTPVETTRVAIANRITQSPQAAGSLSDELDKFMSDTGPKANAIAKSFRDSGGKGLAGFIDSMAFDWYDNVTWDLRQDNKAPKMCKVSLSFSPISDITPGLDHHGANRAPLYPVAGNAPIRKNNK